MNFTDPVEELAALAMWLKQEQEEDFRQHEATLRKSGIHDRKKEGITWFPLKIVEDGYGLGAYPFLVLERNPGDTGRHQFQVAAPVSLFSAVQGNEGESINGTIGYLDDQRMKVSFFHDEIPDWVHDGKIGVNLLFDSRTYDEMFMALNALINVKKGRLLALRNILLGYQQLSFVPRPPVEIPHLNASQQEAVRHMLEAEDLAVIHGPPGTGKTTTLTEGIALLAATDRVLVCAPSNAAVDHLTRCLFARGLRVIRVGNLARVDSDTTAHTLDVLVQQDKEFGRIRELKKKAAELRRIGGKYKRSFGREEAEQRKLIYSEARSLNREARELESYLVQKQLDQAQVITCTLIGSSHEYLKDRRFPVVVIDEAGQGLEPAVWVPVLKSEKVIMAGDPWQLPPTVKSRDASRSGLTTTLLDKVIQRHQRVSLLRVQYRMNRHIMQFSNQEFYGGKLEAHPSVSDWHLAEDPVPVNFIDTAGCGYTEEAGEDGSSLTNSEEGALVLRHLRATLGEAEWPYTVAIISPYRAQVEWLRQEAAEWGLGESRLTINTIDSFQGQERDVVYISLVRSNDSGEIGFLSDYRRINVAMTRAKKKLVMAGDSATLGNDPFYRRLLEYCENQGFYGSAWEWMPT